MNEICFHCHLLYFSSIILSFGHYDIIEVVKSLSFWFQGMKEQYMDIPVNIRQRLDDVNGDEYCGFYVTEVTFKCDVTLETKLWDLARNIQGQLKTIIGQDQHLLFAKVIE